MTLTSGVDSHVRVFGVYLEKPPATLRSRLLWPVYPRYRKRRGIETLPVALGMAFRQIAMTPDGALLLVKNAKAGSSSATQLLNFVASGQAMDHAHCRESDLIQGPEHWRKLLAAIRSGRTYVFSVVRHPESRFLSAFKDFFLAQRNKAARLHIPHMVRRGYDPAGDVGRNIDAFIEYASDTLARSPDRCDHHWREQVRNLAIDHISFDRICRVETLGADLHQAAAEAGVAAHVPDSALNKAYNRSTSEVSLSPAQAARVRELYARDFETFGYN